MKKVILAAIVTLSIVSTSFASGIEGNTIATRSFQADFGNIKNVTWEKIGRCNLASFVQDNNLVKAYYDSDGQLFGTSKNIAVEQLPAHVKRAFSKRYSSYTVKEAVKFDGLEETAWYMVAENDQEKLVLEIKEGSLSVYKRTKK